jgi:hypothetical protein
MNKKRFISIVLTGAFLVGGVVPGFANAGDPQAEVIPISAPINKVISAPAPVFTDIEGHWAYKDITTIVEKGLMPGEKGQFEPEKTVTQVEFLKCLEQVFKDYSVPDMNQGQDQTNITRMEVAKAIEKAFVESKIPVMMTLMFPVYEDTADLTPEESSALSFVFNTGIMRGKTKNNFHPNDPLTKAELAVVLNRTLHTLEIAQPIADNNEEVIITMDGVVSEVNFDENNNIKNILVEAEDNEPFDKAYFLISEETKIVKGEIETKEIQKGQKVSVEYVDGPITKIYPARIGAKLIKIME